jgi:hypothetical protein
MKEYILITVCSKKDESENTFSQRLSLFWTQMLRQTPEEFEKVYAECSEFENHAAILSRKYAILPELAAPLKTKLLNEGLHVLDVDIDDFYSPYEITAPEWMQIEH